MSAKPCENCKMIMVNYADLWLVHTQVASQLKGTKLELRELKAYSLLLGVCTICPLLKSDLEASAAEIKELKHKLDHSSHYSVLSPPCEMCGSLKGKLFHATKENTKLKQEVAYFSSRLERILVSQKMIEDDLSPVEESVTKSTYNHRSYGFDSRENSFVPRRFGYGPRPHRGDHFPRRHGFPVGRSYTDIESRHLNGPCFPYRGSHPTSSNGEVQKTVKTSSGRKVKCWIPKIYLTNPSTVPSTSSHRM
jgi:hypothetical protein